MVIEKVDEVVVITGLGELGMAVATRLGSGHTLLLVDRNQETLDAATKQLRGDGFKAHPALVNVSDFERVEWLAATVPSLGSFRAVIHTETGPPFELTAEEIIAEGVLGTANILHAFAKIALPGSTAVCVAGIGGAMPYLSKRDERALVKAHARKLAALRVLESVKRDKDTAYAFAIRAIQLRVEVASIDWGLKGGRTVSISPGQYVASQTETESYGLAADLHKVFQSPPGSADRLDHIVDAIDFLVSDDASFITGTDLRVDGGALSAAKYAAV